MKKAYNFFNSKHIKRIYVESLEEAYYLISALKTSCPVLTDESGNVVQLSNVEDAMVYIEFKAKTKILKKAEKKTNRAVI
ncbi:hypothetical protein LN42_01885 [Marinitoga sp. 1137]|uniref:hypothetical protein n=1 Tax=Marinitoga sp. 1137 TaxID=1545835 RepID=UPI000950931E|nr:hypothetical protein [Marinitoga sp. 1137]APT75049.1 hypothetical protein LN42_00530 [Marinitoga sp. 1137]APT75279.1 hypothetical protein LN42_01885 [Marinitoga sp. 1137]